MKVLKTTMVFAIALMMAFAVLGCAATPAATEPAAAQEAEVTATPAATEAPATPASTDQEIADNAAAL
ncbi:MAG: hypothetical protein R2912_08495, partial [Eubacteriales bacterium]